MTQVNDHANRYRERRHGSDARGHPRQLALTALNRLEVAHQRCNRQHAGVLALAVDNRAGQPGRHAALLGDRLPAGTPGVAQLALEVADRVKHCGSPFADRTVAQTGAGAQVTLPYMGETSARAVLAANLNRLMAESKHLTSNGKLHERLLA